MAGEESDVRKKHQRSPEEGAEEGSKRRKHSHHRSSHRHHHHHRHRSSKRDRETNREEEEISTPSSPPPTSVVPNTNSDKEEGEIFEEDHAIANGDLTKKKSNSDVESGEIESDEAVYRLNHKNLAISTERDTSTGKVVDENYLNTIVQSTENGVMENSSADVRSDVDHRLYECSHRKDVTTVDGEENESKDLETEDLELSGKGFEKGQFDTSSAGIGSFEVSEKKRKRRRGASSHRERTPSVVDGDIDHQTGKRDTLSESRLTSPKRGNERKKDNGNVDKVVSRRHGRSRSPSHLEEDESRRHRKRDDSRVKMDKFKDVEEKDLVRYASIGHSESADIDRNNLESGHKPKSPDKYTTVHSSSLDKSHEVVHMRNRSRSRDHVRNRSRSRDHVNERISRSRSILQDEKLYRAELDIKSYKNDNDPSESREKDRHYSGMERVARHDGEDRHGSRDWVRDKERERSSSYSRHGGREDRHGSRDARDWGREREREREERERSRTREREMEREREDRDRSKTREREMERVRGRERDKHNAKYRYADRDHRDRNWDRGSEYEKGRDGYRDFRRSKHDESEYHRDKRRHNIHEKESNSRNKDIEMAEEKLKRDEEEREDEKRVVLKVAIEDDDEVERIKEESRRRREAILEKYRQKQSQKEAELHSADPEKADKDSSISGKLLENPSPVKADIRPEGFMSKNDALDVSDEDPLFSVGKSPQQNGSSTSERAPGAGGLGDGTPKSERSEDMFCDDIFGESPAGVRRTGKADGLQVDRSDLNDNWDDSEGYYSYRFGEVLDGRYEVVAAHGKGVFSTVVRAKDLKAGKGEPEEVAIKIIRSNDTMYKAGLDELVILKKLAAADPEDRRHCVRFLSSFKYRNHLCLVFESLHMNLREVLKKFGRNIGLKLTAVRAYAKQLFIALKHLRNCGVLHSDIKPDNMLVNEAKNVLKLCDFGNAMFAGKNEVTPYLVSRFYRAPEIILGLAYDHPLDIWSVGCCLYELYSGKVLFPGPSNNDMLRLHMELKGPFPKKMLRKGAFTDHHFDHDLNFCATEEDPVTKKIVKRLLLNIKPKDIGTIITGSPGEDPKMLGNFKDLLEKIFVLDPEKRMTVSQALSHPFITERWICLSAKDEGKKDDVWSGDLPAWRFFQWDGFCFYCKTTRRRRFYLLVSSKAMRQPIQWFRCLKATKRRLCVGDGWLQKLWFNLKLGYLLCWSSNVVSARSSLLLIAIPYALLQSVIYIIRQSIHDPFFPNVFHRVVWHVRWSPTFVYFPSNFVASSFLF